MNIFEKTLNQEMEKTKDVILNFNWEDPYTYAVWLAQTYNMVNYSTRLVALAGGLCSLDNESLHNRLVDHSKEERGHPIICKNDIKVMGYKYEDLPITAQSSTLFQIQYYWINQVTPASFFGYSLSLEALAYNFGSQIYSAVNKAHGRKATNFLRIHAEEDIEHVETALEEINTLSDFELECATKNLVICCDTYRVMLKRIEEIVSSNKFSDKIAS